MLTRISDVIFNVDKMSNLILNPVYPIMARLIAYDKLWAFCFKLVKYPWIMGKQFKLMMSPFWSRRDVKWLCPPSVFIPVMNHVHAAIQENGRGPF